MNKRDFNNLKLNEFFEENSINIKYPLFYINIIKDIANLININTRDLITPDILGNIVGCNIRGLLSYNQNRGYKNITVDFEYKNFNNGAEVDYIDYNRNLMIEISITDKPFNKLHFNSITNNENYKKIVTSKIKEDGIYIPYYKFILQLSRGSFIK